jgi:hypothetical protein
LGDSRPHTIDQPRNDYSFYLSQIKNGERRFGHCRLRTQYCYRDGPRGEKIDIKLNVDRIFSTLAQREWLTV